MRDNVFFFRIPHLINPWSFNTTNPIFFPLKSWEIGPPHSKLSRGPNLEETHFSHVVPWGIWPLADRILGANFFWGGKFYEFSLRNPKLFLFGRHDSWWFLCVNLYIERDSSCPISLVCLKRKNR